MYPVMFENHTWYHCNFLGHKKEVSSIGGDHVQQCFFVEIKVNKGSNYNVVTCVALGRYFQFYLIFAIIY